MMCFSANIMFTGLIATFLFLEIILSFCAPPLGAACDDQYNFITTWHWKSIIWLDTLQSLLMVILTIVFKYQKAKKDKQGRTEI